MLAEKHIWAFVALVLVAFSIPWFLWGSSRTFVGVPVWIWWHVAWMVVASVSFYVFGRRAWGIGVVEGGNG